MRKRVFTGLFVMVLIMAAVFAGGMQAQAAMKNAGKKGIASRSVSPSAYTARTTGNLRLRSSKSTTADNIKTVIPKNKVVVIRSREANNWFGVIYNGISGYVTGGYLTYNTDKMKTTASLRLRTQMDTSNSNNIIRTMPKNSVVEVITRYKNGWYLVNYKGKSGYASAKYLVKANSSVKVVKVTTAKLRLRSSMSTKITTNVILIIPKGHKVELLSEQENGWVKVSYDGKIGYVVAKYLKNGSDDANSTGVVKVMAENLKVRSTTTKNADNVIGYVKKGQKVTVLAKYTSGWCKIKFGSGVGYIMGGHFTDDTSRVGIG